MAKQKVFYMTLRGVSFGEYLSAFNNSNTNGRMQVKR